MSSVITRCLHKIIIGRLDRQIELDERQRAFRRIDGFAKNKIKPLFLAVLDLSKAFDSLSHASLDKVLRAQDVPHFIIYYIMTSYKKSFTRLVSDGWTSARIYPSVGVKQGDPPSPVLLNIIMDRMLKILPVHIGADLGESKVSAALFADDVFLMASLAPGLQKLINEAHCGCGLEINIMKSHTLSWKRIPKQKKLSIDAKQTFACGNRNLPSIDRRASWKYLGEHFTPEGLSPADTKGKLGDLLQKISRAPLKLQQRLFALRTVVIPSVLHGLALGRTTVGYINKMDITIRANIRK